jgi:hypothetical protein
MQCHANDATGTPHLPRPARRPAVTLAYTTHSARTWSIVRVCSSSHDESQKILEIVTAAPPREITTRTDVERDGLCARVCTL